MLSLELGRAPHTTRSLGAQQRALRLQSQLWKAPSSPSRIPRGETLWDLCDVKGCSSRSPSTPSASPLAFGARQGRQLKGKQRRETAGTRKYNFSLEKNNLFPLIAARFQVYCNNHA